ncbi:hypothetical protein JTB14_037836 [Gonioctena quinquepunctata]|nr:hypothetical protein JTB14_037836 [Gonioctena quinquepunctata]
MDSAIKKATQKESTECKISDTRPLQNNTLAATLSLQEYIAVLLLAERCIECWCFDHTRESCNGSDRSTSCFKCGLAKPECNAECNAEEYCLVCNEKEHHTGSIKCPFLEISFKKARLQSRPTYFSRGNRHEVELRKQKHIDMETNGDMVPGLKASRDESAKSLSASH